MGCFRRAPPPEPDVHQREQPGLLPGSPVQPEWPVYDDFDGTADNTFHALPDVLQGASRIVTGRTSKPLARTTLSFTVAPDAPPVDVFLIRTAVPTALAPLPPVPSGFTDTGVRGTWRDNAENLVPYALYRLTAAPGEIVTVPGTALDYALLLKPHPSGDAPAPAPPTLVTQKAPPGH